MTDSCGGKFLPRKHRAGLTGWLRDIKGRFTQNRSSAHILLTVKKSTVNHPEFTPNFASIFSSQQVSAQSAATLDPDAK